MTKWRLTTGLWHSDVILDVREIIIDVREIIIDKRDMLETYKNMRPVTGHHISS